jgi:hypothetical protein
VHLPSSQQNNPRCHLLVKMLVQKKNSQPFPYFGRLVFIFYT